MSSIKYAQIARDTTAEHENTTTEAWFGDYLTIYANTLRVGDMIEVWAEVEAVDNNSTDTLTTRLMISDTRTDSSTGIKLAESAAHDVADADVITMYACAQVITLGAASTAAITYQGTAALVGATPAIKTTGDSGATHANFATTADLYIGVAADWSVAHADNECHLAGLRYRITRADPVVVS